MKKKKLINQYYIVSITLFIFLFAGCKKGSTPPPAPGIFTVKFAIAGLEYVKLTAGKYLIYKDSASGILDSVVITNSLLETKYTPPTTGYILGLPVTFPGVYSEEFSLTLTKVDGTSLTTWFTGSATTGLPYFNSTDSDLNLSETYDLGTGADYVNLSAFTYSTQYPAYTIPSITIEGKNYTNVIIGEYESGSYVNDPGYAKRTFYWTKGAGIIKREIITTGGAIQTHTLLRHN